MVVMLHWLGGSAQSWTPLAERLAERGMRCVAVDLPGFGAAADRTGYSVRAMADAVEETVRAVRGAPGEPWLLAGFSMGGKVAAVVAHEATQGAEGLAGLRGVVLLAPSPPGPEPMKDSDREHMLQTVGAPAKDAEGDRKHAQDYVQKNAGKPALSEEALEQATHEVLRASKAAFRAWLERGSREDWRESVGEVPLPALVFAGERDKSLGPDAQREHTLRHYGEARLVELAGAGHLLPMERPGEIAERVVEFCAELALPVSRALPVGEQFAALLQSERVSPQTRAVMQERLQADDAGYEPQTLGRQGLRILRELARRVVPGAPFDGAARIDRELAGGQGDGWRYDKLPDDCTAWRRGLASLNDAAKHAYGVSFVGLEDAWQDALLAKAAAGSLGEGLGERVLHVIGIGAGEAATEPYSGAEMKLWFEEVRGALAKLYIADPRSMERVGFQGFADESGFTKIRLGEREAWES